MSARKSLDQIAAAAGRKWHAEQIEAMRDMPESAKKHRMDAQLLEARGGEADLSGMAGVDAANYKKILDGLGWSENWSDEGYERLAAAVADQPEERSTGFLVVFFSIVGFALGCLVTAAVLYSKAWGG